MVRTTGQCRERTISEGAALAGAAAGGLAAVTEVHAKSQDDGQLVVVLPEVLETAGHVLGNLFQRLYHSIDSVQAEDAPLATELRATSCQLEECLQLLIDYVAPLPPELQAVPATDIAQSLVRHLEDTLARPVSVSRRLEAATDVMVDVARISRAFDLLAGRVQGATAGTIAAAHLSALATPGTLALSVSLRAQQPVARDSLSELRWAVVEKLFDIHGGSIREDAGDSGEIEWSILLPLQVQA